MMSKLHFLIIFATLLVAESIELRCYYDILSYNVVGSAYTCKLQDINIYSPSEVTSIAGTHYSGKNNNNVKAIKIISGICNYFPSKFESFFTNIEAIHAYAIQLKSLTSEDLKPFSKLRFLYLSKNNLEVLESRLFTFNPNLERVYFESNKLKSIGYNILSSLTKLKEAHFDSNNCINSYATSQSGLENLKKNLNEKCFNLQFELISLEDKISDLMRENKNLTSEMVKLKRPSDTETLTEEITKLRSELDSAKSKIKQNQAVCEEKVRTFKVDVDTLSAKFLKLEANLTEEKSENEEKLQKLKSKIEEANKSIVGLDNELQANISTLKSDLRSLKQELSQNLLKNENKVKILTSESAKISADILTLKNALDSKSSEFEENHLKKFNEVLRTIKSLETEVTEQISEKFTEFNESIASHTEESQSLIEFINEKISSVNESAIYYNETCFEAITENRNQLLNMIHDLNDTKPIGDFIVAEKNISDSNESFRKLSMISWVIVISLLIATWMTMFINRRKQKISRDLNMEFINSVES